MTTRTLTPVLAVGLVAAAAMASASAATPMPPHPPARISDADLAAAIAWVLQH